MLLARRVTKTAFDGIEADDTSIIRAAKYLDDDEVSVFKIEDSSEAELALLLYAATNTDTVEKVDYILIESEILVSAGYVVVPRPDDNLHPFLSSRHYEIHGVESKGGKVVLARLLLENKVKAFRISRSDAIRRVQKLSTNDDELKSRLRPKWAKRIDC